MTEKIIHRQVCEYIRIQYPSVLFNSDMSGAMRLSIGQAVQIKALRSNRGFPDLAIYKQCKGYSGLFIELKKDGEKILNKSGKPATEHIAEQQECMARLAMEGYYCTFAIGFDAAKKIIDNYLT